ncbi:MAG: hypothetical protein HYZ69_00220 [Candidatus Colwellbacteria bacterium]|nr:hypothetical protein [Candidatus Colwellbacteria bacterium]
MHVPILSRILDGFAIGTETSKKTKILGIGCQGIIMPNTIQLGEYSMGSDD